MKVSKFPNLRSLKLFACEQDCPSDFWYFKLCRNLEIFLFDSESVLGVDECCQFSELKNLIEVDLRSVRLSADATLVLFNSLPCSLRRFRHFRHFRDESAMFHFSVVVDRFRELEEFAISSFTKLLRAEVSFFADFLLRICHHTQTTLAQLYSPISLDRKYHKKVQKAFWGCKT